jgi:Restriction endonuclease S subunits
MVQTEIGLFPVEWNLKNLEDSFTLKARIGWQGLTTSEYMEVGEYLLVTGTDFKNGYIEWDNCVFVERIRFDQDKSIQLRNGDVLVTKDGTIGKVAYVDFLPKPATLNSGVFVLRPKARDIDNRFFFYVLMSFYFDEFLVKITAGSTITHLYQKDFVNFNFICPPLPEQETIAEALSDADEWIESLEKLIAKKRLIKKGAMQELLTSKEGWEKKRLGELLLRNPEYGINAAAVKYQDKLPTYLRITDISENGTFLQDGKVSVDHFLSVNYMLDAGDVCIARTGASVGKSYYHKKENGNLVFAGFLIRLKVNPQLLNSKLLFYITKSQSYQDYINSNSLRSGQPGINSLELQSYEFFIPNSLTEQTRIATILSDMDAELETLTKQLEKARKIKQGMMQELLTGRIRLV